jgi:hypothetical protein
VRLAVELSQREGRFVGKIVVTDANGATGRRSIEGTTCAEVEQASAFFAGLAIDLGGHLEGASATEVAPPAPVNTPAPAPASARATRKSPLRPEPQRATARSSEVALGGGGGVRSGLGPGLRAVVEVGVWLGDAGSQSFAPAFGASLVGAQSSVGAGGGQAELRLLAARLEVSLLRLTLGPVAFRPCAGLEIGPMLARGEGVALPRSDTTLFLAAELTLLARWTIGRHFFAAGAAGPSFPLRHTRYAFFPETPVYTLPWVAARGELGIGIFL